MSIFITETLRLTLSSSCWQLPIRSLTKSLLTLEKIDCQEKQMSGAPEWPGLLGV